MVNERLRNITPPAFPFGNTMEETKQNMLGVLLSEEYGYLPNRETSLSWEVKEEQSNYAAGKATLFHMVMHAEFPTGTFSFPFRAVIPNKKEQIPFFVHINFRPDVPDRYQPTEEIVDNGYAVLSFCYQDVTSDDGDFGNGVAPYILGASEQRADTDCGKIAMWAWAASKIMDYAETIPELDKSRAAVAGHSRLGKTALLTGAQDSRFSLVISNDSGCSGAAVTRGKQGEDIETITRVFPFWFCKNYQKYANRHDNLPFDQHWLVAASLPARVCIGSAEEDLWADPEAEFLSCVLADEYGKHFGLDVFPKVTEFPKTGDRIAGNMACYHVRPGCHYFGREDWLVYMAYEKMGNQ